MVRTKQKEMNYFYPAKLVTRNYKPLHLEKGMLFLSTLYRGTENEYSEIWQLQSNNYNLEDFIKLHGYPIRILITDEYEYDILAEDDKIGWYMDEEDEMLNELSLEEINYILQQGGNIDILIEDTEDDETIPVLEEGKVIIRIPIEEDYE